MSAYRFGDILKIARQERGADLKAVANETRIQAKYLHALETEDFGAFITEVQLKGFLSKYCEYLGLDFARVYALYRRDFGKDLEKLEPTEKSRRRFSLPRKYILPLTIVTVALLVIGGILISIVVRGFAPPRLILTSPIEIEAPFEGVIVVSTDLIILEGNLPDDAVLRLNGDPLPTDSGGNFKTRELPLGEGDNLFILSALNSLNRETEIRLNISKAPQDDPERIDDEEL